MMREMNLDELGRVSGGSAVNGMYYTNTVYGWSPYLIKKGDCLSALAAARGTSVAAIRFANPLITNPDFIVAGNWILLPKK